MQHSVAIYGKLLLVIGVMGYLAGGTAVWSAIGPALLGIIVLAVTRGPLRTSSASVAGTAGTLIAMLALCSSANAVADIPAVMAGDPAVDGLMTLSRSLTALVSLAILFALAAHWLQGGVIGRGPEDAAADVSAEHRDCRRRQQLSGNQQYPRGQVAVTRTSRRRRLLDECAHR